MDKYLRAAIENLLLKANQCSSDNHGFIQCFPIALFAELQMQYDKDCRKHFKPMIRISPEARSENAVGSGTAA